MKERPILFNTAMVQAILSGRKTQTRRLVPEWQLPSETDGPHDQFPMNRFISIAQRDPRYGFGVFGETAEQCMDNYNKDFKSLCPFGRIGDCLWVRETFGDCGVRLTYKADADDGAHCMVKRWIPSIHMPRSACRIILEITGLRVERLQDISEGDALAEGIPELLKCKSPADEFRMIWEQTGGDWDANPWVWVIEFKVLTTNGVVPGVAA